MGRRCRETAEAALKADADPCSSGWCAPLRIRPEVELWWVTGECKNEVRRKCSSRGHFRDRDPDSHDHPHPAKTYAMWIPALERSCSDGSWMAPGKTGNIPSTTLPCTARRCRPQAAPAIKTLDLCGQRCDILCFLPFRSAFAPLFFFSGVLAAETSTVSKRGIITPPSERRRGLGRVNHRG